MAAGLGFKTFTTGEVLTAADTNGYLMQGVLVFASAAARDAAITSPQEGQFAYLKDTNVTTYYTGSAWANLDTTGMTNPMTTTGDMVYSSPGSTPVRLGIGTTGQVLSVAGGIPSWAAASSGALTLVSTTSFSAVSSQSFNNVFSSTYTNYKVMMNFHTSSGGTTNFRFRAAGSDLTAANYSGLQYVFTASGAGSAGFGSSQDSVANLLLNSYNNTSGIPTGIDMTVYDPMSTSARKNYSANIVTSNIYYGLSMGFYYGANNTAFDGFTLVMNSGTMTGSVSVYGMSK